MYTLPSIKNTSSESIISCLLLPTCASKQGNVIGLRRYIVYTLYVYKTINTRSGTERLRMRNEEDQERRVL